MIDEGAALEVLTPSLQSNVMSITVIFQVFFLDLLIQTDFENCNQVENHTDEHYTSFTKERF